MRYLLIAFILYLLSCNKSEQELNGAYEQISSQETSLQNRDSLRNITLMQNGYWITTSFTKNSILKCFGGAYKINHDQCIQKFNFNSADTSIIGKELSCKYNLENNSVVAGFDNSNVNKESNSELLYKRMTVTEPLKNASLEGVWAMKPGQAGYSTDNNEILRIFAFPAFTRTIYNFKEKRFYNTYGGTYQFDGKELVEKIEYSNYQIPPGSSMEWSVKKLAHNEIQLFDIDSFNDEEIFDQIGKQ